MKYGLTLRRLNYIILSVVAVAALYLAACMHVLSRLDVTNLTIVYVLASDSAESPIMFPMPGWVRDVYWSKFGREKIFTANERTNVHVEFLNNAIAPPGNLAPYKSLNVDRAQMLLTQLVCAKCDDGQAMQKIKEFQQKWSSQPLSAAIQRCECEKK